MKTKADAIRAFEAAGYPLIPLKGKRPYGENWERTAVGAHAPDALVEGGNYGVVLGAEDVVIDVDPRNYAPGDKPLERLGRAIGGVPAGTLVTRTGAGGLHIFLKKPADVAVRNGVSEYQGIEFKAGPGRQVVGPGSVHPDTGQVYRHLQGTPASIARAPQALLDLIARAPATFSQEGTGGYKDDEATLYRAALWLRAQAPAVQGQRGDEATYKAACGLRESGLSPKRAYELLLSDFNPRCQPPWDDDELVEKVQHAYTYAKGAVGGQHPEAVFDPIEADKKDTAARAAMAEADDDAVGKSGWKLDNKKQPVKCLQNLLNYFSIPSANLRGIFGYDEFERRVKLIKAAPWGSLPGLPITDIDLSRLRAHLARNHGYDASKDDLVDAMVEKSQQRRYHPVKEYLGALKWDGVKRLDTWLEQYLGADHDDPDYVSAVGRKTLTAAVARVYEPGCKFDHVLVLEGVQNLGKSGVIKVLAGEWFSDFKLNLGKMPDTIQMMQGKWIVEMAELHTARVSDVDEIKAFLTRTKDEARFAYGRLPGEYKRQGIFIGTFNPTGDMTWMKDDENRRWWPVRCRAVVGRHFDFAGLKAVRDQLWAEAAHLYKKGEALTMETETLQDVARVAQSERRAEHPWAERVAGWLAVQDNNAETKQDFYTGREVYIGAMGGLDVRYGRREQTDVAKALRELNWETGYKKEVVGEKTITVRGFWRPGAESRRRHRVSVEKKDDAALFGDLA